MRNREKTFLTMVKALNKASSTVSISTIARATVDVVHIIIKNDTSKEANI